LLEVLNPVVAAHDPLLLTLACVISAVMAFAAVSVLARVRAIERRTWAVWFGAATLFGCGAWAANVVALSGFRASGPASFDLNATLWSLALFAVGMIAACFAFLAMRGRLAGSIAAGILLAGFVTAAQHLAIGGMRFAEGVLDSTPAAWAAPATAIAFSVVFFMRVESARPALRRLEAMLYLTAALVAAYLVGISTTIPAPGADEASAGTRLGADILLVGLAASGFVILGLSLAGDVLERHALQQAQHESVRLLELVGAAFEGIVIHRDGVILETSEPFRALGDWTEKELAGHPLIQLAAADDSAAIDRGLRVVDDSAPPLAFHLVTKDGREIPVEVVSRVIDYGGTRAIVTGFRDQSMRVRAEERIRHLAHHDALTGLPNRFLLADRLTQMINLARRNGTIVAVFHLGLDRFKAVNDLLGHDAGDLLLVEASRRLLETLRSSDTLARPGGDEFVIIQPLVQQPREAAILARRLVEAFSHPFDINGLQTEVSISIGIAVLPDDGETATELLHNADTAMYRAKQEGKGIFLFFEQAMDRKIQERRQLEQDLRQAVSHGELELHYQPLFDCSEATVCGFEALVRWNHPIRGMISPGEFIPLAEETGIIGAIGRWVLERASAEAVGWAVPHRIAVNLSPVQFRQPDLPAMVAEILARSGLPPERLELEVTEGVLIDNTDRAIEVLTQLKAQGINISLDDFGTGYSSLSYLRRFPFDKIKIDQSFVKGLGQDDEAIAIVSAIVALGRSLRLSITAEGVETEHQLSTLRELACNQVQGFLLGRPMRVHNLPALIGGAELRALSPDTCPAPGSDTAA
jgi:diguanylate cyclase (GGDEF)-like protein/PAS domain S-box-containing protein